MSRVLLQRDAGIADIVQPHAEIAIQASPQQFANRCRRSGGNAIQVNRCAQYIGQRLRHRLAGKQRLPRQHLKQHHAERPDIRPPVHCLPAGLFRTHVGGRAQNDPGFSGLGQRRRVRRIGCGPEHGRQTEVEHLYSTVGRDDDIRGFEVAMDDSYFVRGFEGFGHLPGVVHGSCERQRSFEGFAENQLHHQRAFFDSVDVRDVGMVERCQHFGLALESRHALAVIRKCLGQHLDRNLAFQLGIFGSIYFAHSTLADRHKNFVRANAGTSRERHCWVIPADSSVLPR